MNMNTQIRREPVLAGRLCAENETLAAEVSPVNQALLSLNKSIQHSYQLQEALESKLTVICIPYPVRDIRGQEKTHCEPSTSARPVCTHESMLADLAALVANLGERQESLLKALQI